MFYLFEVVRNAQESFMTSVVHMILILVSNLVSIAQCIDKNKNNRDTRMVHRYVFFFSTLLLYFTHGCTNVLEGWMVL